MMQGTLAKLKEEIMEIVAYTDLTAREFISGEFEKRDLLAARWTLHQQALRLLDSLNHMIAQSRK